MVAFALVGFSCAESIETDYTEVELTSFDKWMAKYYPEYPKVTDGLYYKIVKGDNPNGYTPDSIADWIYVNYTGQDLEGNYFANTYVPLAKHLGTYANTTHFVPLVSSYQYSSTILTTGALYALAEMQEGDSVDIFMSSDWIGSTANAAPYTGFEGNLYSAPESGPARVSLKFESMTSNPSKDGYEAVERYAMDTLGLTLADSLETGIYYKLLVENPEGDTIPTDSSVYLIYTGMFLDGFVFDTNDEDVADSLDVDYSDDSGSYSPIIFSYSGVDDSGDYVDGFAAVTKKLRVGETAICVFTSENGYGAYGSTSGNTIIQPYDPLVFKIKVLTEDEMDDY